MNSGSSLAWLYLVIAGVLEAVWSLGLKFTHGFREPVATVITVVAIVGSMVLLGYAVRTLPIGTAYAVWVGIGIVGAAVGGIVLFQEPVSWARLSFLALLFISIVGLKMTSAP